MLSGTGNSVALVGRELLQPDKAAAKTIVIAAIKREATLSLHSLAVTVVGERSMLCGGFSLEVGCFFSKLRRLMFDALLERTLE